MNGRRAPSEIGDQADRLRELVRQTDGTARTIAVTSGKGGVGKTNVAVNLAICLAARGQRVVLFDADFGLANADLLLNVEARFNLSHVLAGARQIHEILTPAPGGIDLVPGASGIGRLADLTEFDRSRLLAMLDRLEREADVLILDCGGGIARSVTALAGAADLVLAVTAPEPTALADAYASIKVMAGRASPAAIAVVVNLASDREQARAACRRLAGVASKFLHLRLADYGYILRDEHVGQAVCQRVPVVLRYPRCPASSCLMALAGRIAQGVHAAGYAEGFFRRVVNLFF